MKVSDLMQALSDAGAPMEAILIAVRAVEEKEAELALRDAKEAEKKAKDAARKKAERDAARTVQGQSADTDGTVQAAPLSLSPNENKSNPHTHTPEKQTPARKAVRLPVDWEPEPLTADTGKAVAAWPPGAIDRELARFRDWAASANGPNALKKDWQAAWRNWVRKADDEGRYHDRSPTHSRPNSRPRDGFAAALDDTLADLGPSQPPGPTGRHDAGTGQGHRAGSVVPISAVR